MQHTVSGGDTLIIPAPGTSFDSHLWIVLSDPTRDHFVLLVNLTSYRADKDDACILDVGDHPFIQHRSCVNYAKVKHIAVAQLEAILKMPAVERREPLSAEVLRRIREGAGKSKFIELGYWQMLVEQGLVSE
jgi:hypothetical protein